MKSSLIGLHQQLHCKLAIQSPSDRQPSWPKVLCIDDDPEISRAIEVYLRGYQVHVLRAYHGMQGHWLAATEKPDCIITDLSMPQGSGEHLLDCLKRNADTARIPIIVLTARRASGLAGLLVRRGADRLLNKPVELDDLLTELARHIVLNPRVEDGSSR